MSSSRNKKRCKGGKSLTERFNRRKPPERESLPVKVIVCDDSKTAPSYFNALAREVQDYVTLRVIPARCAASTNTIVDDAIEQFRRLKSKGLRKKDRVWALIDYEHEPHLRKNAEDVKPLIKPVIDENKRLNVALSDPCFELWTLLHLIDTGEQFTSNDAILDRIRSAWKSQFQQEFPAKKAQADYKNIISKRHEAAKRAKRHWEREDPSRTEVYKIIEDIGSHAPGTK